MREDQPPGCATVVLFGTYDATLHDRIAVLRDGLRAAGHQVTEVNAPLRSRTDDRIAATNSMSGAGRLLIDVLRCWTHLVVRRLRTRGRPDAVLVGYLGHFDVHLARLLYPGSLVVLDHLVSLSDTATDRRTGGRRTQRLLRWLDRLATGAADVVLIDTEEHLEVVDAGHRGRCLVVPVGASDRWHTAGRTSDGPDPADRPLRVVFFGQYTPLQGCATIGSAAALLADRDDVEFTLVGHGQDRPATESLAAGARVRWIDWLDLDELVRLVEDSHVALGVFGTGPKARRVVPHKVFQSIAAGCAVVTSDTPPQRRLLGDGARYCPPGDADALARILVGLAEDVTDLTAARAAAAATAVRFRPVEITAALSSTIDRETAAGSARNHRLPALTPNAWLRWDLMAPVLEALPPGRALEVGPGRGAVAARLVAMGHDYTGVEMSEVARAHTAELLDRPGNATRVIASTSELDPEDRFDLVCAFEVIEHIDDDAAALRAWSDLLAPGGTLILTTPADPDRFAAADEAVGHFRRYLDAELAQMAERAGLVDVSVRRYGAGLGDVLEHGRNVILGRRLRRARTNGVEPTLRTRTEESNAMLQPPDVAGPVTRVLTAPARRWQRGRPEEGPGLVLVARRPD